MLPILLTILTMVVLGLPVTLSLRLHSRPGETLGLSYLLGSGVCFLALLTLSVLGIRWSLPPAAGVALAISGAFLFVHLRRVTARSPRAPHAGDDAAAAGICAWLIDLATLLVFAAYSFYATLAPLWEWDFWAIWGLKGRVFLEHGGIDWAWLASPFNVFAHTDYPLLLPLSYDAAALASGGWNDRWLGLLFVAFAASLTLIARDAFRRHTAPLAASIGTFLIASIATTFFVGMADGPLIALSGAALLYLFEAIRSDDAGDSRTGAVLLGLAANCKNEGLALLVAAGIGLLAADFRNWRRVIRLWPAAALALPWLLLRAAHTLPTDLATGSITSRLATHLRQLPEIAGWLAESLPEPWFWAILIVAAVAGALWTTRNKAADDTHAISFLFITAGIQLAFYLGSYLITPHDVRWHITTSWDRLSAHLAVPVVFATVILLGSMGNGRQSNPE